MDPIDPFVIRLDNFDFAPKALVRRGKLWGTVIKRVATDDGRTGYLVQLPEPVTTLQGWRPRRVGYLVVTPRDPGDEIVATSYNVTVEISYVLDPAVVRAEGYRQGQADYVALGHASAGMTQY
jgi:hypothetical protein